jgi:acyl dehydratase
VQAWVDLRLKDTLRVGTGMTSVGAISAIGELPPGAAYVRKFDISGVDGQALAELDACSMILGQRWGQPGVDVGANWDWLDGETRWTSEFRVEAWDPHVFAQCTKTFNPIHLSKIAAVRAGLHDRPYQGIATLLRSVSVLVEQEFGGFEEDIRRIAGVFRGPVFPGTTIQIECTARWTGPEGSSLYFRAVKEDGMPAIERGVVESQSSRRP